MTGEIELVHGSGNVFRDFGKPDADIWQAKAMLAAKIIAILDDRALTVREAQAETGIAAADFSRIRKAKLDRFTIDRLMIVLNRLGQEVELEVKVHPRRSAPARGDVRAPSRA